MTNNGYIVQRLTKDGDWADFQGFAELEEAKAFIAGTDTPAEWKIIECEECD